MQKRIIFLVGGPDFHPVNAQAELVIDALGSDYACHTAESLAAFEHLDECDLLVVMGMHWTGWGDRYRPPRDPHKRLFEKYVASGKPIMSVHGGIASYDDWPDFGRLIGFTWVMGETSHTIVTEHAVRVIPTGHPLVDGVNDYTITDDIPLNIKITEGMRPRTHADAPWNGRRIPALLSATGGRIEGAGKTLYLANGHDLRAYECAAYRKLWINGVQWCLAEE
jgi:type 1 glutamine amidotransferase